MTKIIAHRGAKGLAPENTLAAIAKGLDSNADEIEIDIRITRDQVPVLCHNLNLAAGNDALSISHHTYAELKQQRKDLTTLTEALQAVQNRAVLYIEVKRGEPVQPVVDAVTEHLQTAPESKLLFGSKSQKTLRELHQLLPNIPAVVIEPWSGVRAGFRARQLKTKRISMRSWWLWGGFLKGMQRRGYLITPYTMNDPVKVAKWQPYIYGVVTDYPDRFTR